MPYVKVDPDTFDDVQPIRRVKLSEINAQLDALIAKRDSMAEVTDTELIAWARQFHPILNEKETLLAEIDLIIALKTMLEAL